MRTIVSIILALFLMVVAVNPTYNRESFESAPVVTITSANVADYIYKIYRADVKAIQNLADIAAQLQAGGITCPGTFSVSNQLNVSGNTAIGGTLNSAAITSPTITDLWNKIAALQSRYDSLETRANNLANKTSALSADGANAAFSGTLSASGTTTLNVTTINNNATFNRGTVIFMPGDVRFDSGSPFFREVDGDRSQWYKVIGPCTNRGEGISVNQYNANFVYINWRKGCPS